jgi:hypothetical protein
MPCYKSGGCGSYEMHACNECPASKPEYLLKEKAINIYVATLNGDVKDHYMAIGLSHSAAEQNLVNLYFNDKKHTAKDLGDNLYITITAFTNGRTAVIL